MTLFNLDEQERLKDFVTLEFLIKECLRNFRKRLESLLDNDHQGRKSVTCSLFTKCLCLRINDFEYERSVD